MTWRARACLSRAATSSAETSSSSATRHLHHVGIYAGNGQFVHATHRGSPVQVTALDADYYRDRYMTAVRLSPR